MIKQCCVLLMLLALGIPVCAQSNYATLTGTVRDVQQLPVAGAAVELTATGTGAVRRAVTNQQGIFDAPALLPDEYELKIEANGFAITRQTIRLEVGQKSALNITLKVGTLNEGVKVTAGNEVLRVLGMSISNHVRTEDVPARYGGDEFAIVMPDTPRDEAEKVVERLMEILDKKMVDLPSGGRKIPMPDLSWGVASYPLDGRSARELVENADTRAYARKRSR